MVRCIVIILLFLLAFPLFPLSSYGAEIKIVASVNDEIISNHDLVEQQRIMSFINDGAKISSSEALDNLIKHHLFVEYAKKLDIALPENQLDGAMEFFKRHDLPNDINLSSLRNYIRNELLCRKVIEALILPTVKITDDQVESQKALLRRDQNSFNILQISQAGEVTNLGWLEANELNKNIRDTILNAKINQETKKIDGNKFKVLDKENSIILSANFEIETGEKKVMNIQLKELDKENRDKFLATASKSNNSNKSMISYQGQKIKVLNNNLNQLIKMELYKNEVMAKEEKLKNELIKNAVIMKK